MKSTGYCCLTFKKLKFSQRNFNFLKRFPPPTKKIIEGRQVGAESFQEDRHDAGNTGFS